MSDGQGWKTEEERIFRFDIAALQSVSKGICYDLSSGWWPGMPLADAHPTFGVLSYRTPQGQRVQQDIPFMKDNAVGFGFISELLMCTVHSGTHIDALAHVVCGSDPSWYGDRLARENLGDFGPIGSDASELPPMLARGVLMDIPKLLGLDHMEAGASVDADMLQQACKEQGIDVSHGDVVLIRTGTMQKWPDREHLARCHGSGLALEGAEWLVEQGAIAIGGDNESLECQPSRRAGDPQPVHRFLIREQGIPILEWVYLEDLARDGVYSFLFLCLPLTVSGATGSMVRPIAVI